MNVRELHAWQVSPSEARKIQLELAGEVVRINLVREVRYIAGSDISGKLHGGRVTAAVVVLRYPELSVAEIATADGEPPFPYVPGLLSFREIPLLAQAFKKLSIVPDIVVADGQGIAHPRRFGLAAHLGVLLDRPTIGCAKSHLCGEHGIVENNARSWAELVDGNEVIGAALRTGTGRKPVYVSIGHKIDLAGAIEWVMKCVRRYRLPEPTRMAHLAAAGQL